MAKNKVAVSLLFKQSTMDLIIELYKKDCPNREQTLSYWIDNLLSVALTEKEVLG